MKRKTSGDDLNSKRARSVAEVPLSISSRGELLKLKIMDTKIFLEYRHEITSEEEAKSLSSTVILMFKEVELKKELSMEIPGLDEFLNAYHLKNETTSSVLHLIEESFGKYAEEHKLSQDWKSFKETAKDSHEFFKICPCSYLKAFSAEFGHHRKDSLESWMEVLINNLPFTFQKEASIIWAGYLEKVSDFSLGSKLEVALALVKRFYRGRGVVPLSFTIENLLDGPTSIVVETGLRLYFKEDLL